LNINGFAEFSWLQEFFFRLQLAASFFFFPTSVGCKSFFSTSAFPSDHGPATFNGKQRTDLLLWWLWHSESCPLKKVDLIW